MGGRIALLVMLAALAGTGLGAKARAQAQPPGNQGGPDSLGADWGPQQNEVRAGVKQGRYVSLFHVIGEIRRRTPGRELDAGLEQAAGRAVYRVRWAAADGRRIDYIVDASSGAIISGR